MPPKQPATPDLKDLLPADLRVTKQRSGVFGVLCESKDHPTATEVFLRMQKDMPTVSLATVYNCLDTLASCGAINTVQVDRGPARYCANLEEHVHFHCSGCGSVFDAPPRESLQANRHWKLPTGAKIGGIQVVLHGTCSDCTAKASPQ